jgi:hypothetical protein
VTEYVYHDLDQFETEVELFTPDEITSQITDLLQAYRHFHFHRDEIDRDEIQDFEKRANVALDTFRAMFRDRLGNGRFLVDREEDFVLATLQAWATERTPLSHRGRQVASSLAECSALLMKLTSEQASQEPAMWPYISKIRFGKLSPRYILGLLSPVLMSPGST